MSLVRDFLKQKDTDYSSFIPSAYKLSAEDKLRVTITQNLRSKYELDAAGKCIQPCFRNMNTPVVSEFESECMTNCIAKSLETLAHLQLFSSR